MTNVAAPNRCPLRHAPLPKEVVEKRRPARVDQVQQVRVLDTRREHAGRVDCRALTEIPPVTRGP